MSESSGAEKFPRVNENIKNLKNTRENQKLLTEVKTPAHWEERCVDQGRLPIPAEKKVVLRIIILGWSSSEAYDAINLVSALIVFK